MFFQKSTLHKQLSFSKYKQEYVHQKLLNYSRTYQIKFEIATQATRKGGKKQKSRWIYFSKYSFPPLAIPHNSPLLHGGLEMGMRWPGFKLQPANMSSIARQSIFFASSFHKSTKYKAVKTSICRFNPLSQPQLYMLNAQC